MTDILAPSNVGFTKQEVQISGKWRPKIATNWVTYSSKPTILSSYKSATKHSNGILPTNYCRMISRLSLGGPVDAYNKSYVFQADTANGISIKSKGLPHGCDIPNGVVKVPTWLTDKVVLDASAEMNQLGANILEDLGQLRQTGNLVASIVSLIYDLYQACFRGNWKAVRRRLREVGSNVPVSIANGWLMYFYGIRPLVSTIDALCTAEQPINKTLSVRKRFSMGGEPYLYTNAPSYFDFQCSGKASVQAQCELFASIKMSGNLHTWSKLGVTGNTFTDAVVTAWALVPYSFVIDWFIPVENWLRSLVWSTALEYQGGYTGARHYVECTITNRYPWTYVGGAYGGTLPKARLSVRFYQRTTYPYTVPPVYLGIRLSLSSTQIISASALISKR